MLFAASPIELCGSCHSHEHAVAHPMGEGSYDPRTGAELDCLSCHGIHDAPYPKYMHLSGKRELCLACHENISPAGRKR